jgi:hypothetical protein
MMARGNVFGGLNGGGGNNIKSIQRGRAQITTALKDITIAGVDLSKSIVILSQQGQTNSTPRELMVMGELTSSTNLQLTTYAYSSSFYVSWTVIEFKDIKSLQKGKTIVPSFTAVTATVSAVDLSKSILFYSFKHNWTGQYTAGALAECGIVDSTTLSFQQSQSSEKTFAWYLVEFI